MIIAMLALFFLMRHRALWFPLARAHPRRLPIFVLCAPIASLVLSLVVLRICLTGAVACFGWLAGCITRVGWPLWLQMALVVLALSVLGAGLLAAIRLLLFGWYIERRSVQATAALHQGVADLAERIGTAPPRIRVWAIDRPIALASGIIRPTMILSTWMMRHLDQHELETVVAHELAHLARHDQRMLALATWLRDAFWYLPTSRLAWRQLHVDQEYACDDIAVRVTQHPLALASALAKVWHAGVTVPGQEFAPALLASADVLETRIARLAALPCSADRPSATDNGASLRAVSAYYAVFLLTLVSCGFSAIAWWLH